MWVKPSWWTQVCCFWCVCLVCLPRLGLVKGFLLERLSGPFGKGGLTISRPDENKGFPGQGGESKSEHPLCSVMHFAYKDSVFPKYFMMVFHLPNNH